MSAIDIASTTAVCAWLSRDAGDGLELTSPIDNDMIDRLPCWWWVVMGNCQD
jgi:hypothetical protein